MNARAKISIADRAWRLGIELAPQYLRRGETVTDRTIMWALFVFSHETLERAYSKPPLSSFPTRAMWPEYQDETTWRAKMAEYLRGERPDIDEEGGKPPMPPASEITIAEWVMHLYHATALHGARDWHRRRRALILYASGRPPRVVAVKTGISPTELKRSRWRAMDDMLERY